MLPIDDSSNTKASLLDDSSDIQRRIPIIRVSNGLSLARVAAPIVRFAKSYYGARDGVMNAALNGGDGWQPFFVTHPLMNMHSA